MKPTVLLLLFLAVAGIGCTKHTPEGSQKGGREGSQAGLDRQGANDIVGATNSHLCSEQVDPSEPGAFRCIDGKWEKINPTRFDPLQPGDRLVGATSDSTEKEGKWQRH